MLDDYSSHRLTTAWNDVLPTLVHHSGRPACVSLASLGPGAAALTERKPIQTEIDGGKGSGIASLPSKPGISRISDDWYMTRIAYSEHPGTVSEGEVFYPSGLPRPQRRLHSSLASSSIYYTPRNLTRSRFPPATHGYSIHLLLTAAHPHSSYPFTLDAYMRDVTQSFVDLQILAEKRWNLSSTCSDRNASILPWHILAVSFMSNYSLAAALPAFD